MSRSRSELFNVGWRKWPFSALIYSDSDYPAL